MLATSIINAIDLLPDCTAQQLRRHSSSYYSQKSSDKTTYKPVCIRTWYPPKTVWSFTATLSCSVHPLYKCICIFQCCIGVSLWRKKADPWLSGRKRWAKDRVMGECSKFRNLEIQRSFSFKIVRVVKWKCTALDGACSNIWVKEKCAVLVW